VHVLCTQRWFGVTRLAFKDVATQHGPEPLSAITMHHSRTAPVSSLEPVSADPPEIGRPVPSPRHLSSDRRHYASTN
jgi:hypothetical protein